MATSNSNFRHLPVELLQAIAFRLPAEDLCSFRLSCKSIYESTMYTFRCTFFEMIGTNLSLKGLERVEAIVNDSELAPHVRSLTVKFVDDFEDRLAEGLRWNRHSSGYLLLDADVQQWAEALRGLVNCTSFHLIRKGWTDNDTCLDRFTSTDIITLILSAIIEAHIPVQEFLVDFVPPCVGGANELDLRRLNVPALWKPEFTSVWASLQVLLLNFTMEKNWIIDWIDPMVRYATDLRKLTIKFDDGRVARAVIEQLSSIGTTSQLQELTLNGVAKSIINPASLSKLLHNYRDSLRVINITYIPLEGSGWKSILKMLGEFPVLESFSFDNLREFRYAMHFPVASEIPTVDQGTEFVIFRPRKLRDQTWNTRVRCRGPNAKAILQRLADSLEPLIFPKRNLVTV
ncbi:hypothetical protein PEX1_021720 [Penicillium expansum]|nr:hypothetical protein PEXP_007160 [Penicillium expansum]KGO45417.1 hypothetical protein PEX1_021720 [Penicillium expansum]